ncbi:MAG: manganese efflux pump [Thermoleophilia bacterium]|nr:manganese efflux pump [Thermoleophilia bacterium]
MSAAELMTVGLIIGVNNFAVALLLGALGQEGRRWRIAGVFGVFEFTIPLVGLLIGSVASDYLADAGRFISATLLVGLGLLAIREATAQDASLDEHLAAKVTTWGGLMLLAAGLSMDNLVVGFALGLGDTDPFLLSAVIASFAVAYTLLGLRLGTTSRRHWGRSAQAASGLLLILLAVAVAAGRFA